MSTNNISSPIINKSQGLWNSNLYIFHTLPSTNTYCMENIKELNNGTVIRAVKQTAGKGRFTRKWEAPGEKCLTISIVITQNNNSSFVDFLPTTAVAIHKTLKKYNINALLKWPNDVMVNGKKISGILAEAEQSCNKLIVGIGLNINMTIDDFKSMNLLQPATAILIETGIKYDIGKIYSTLITNLEKTYDKLNNNGLSDIIKYWNNYDYLSGRNLTLQNNKNTITGKYAGMQNNGQIKIIDSNNTPHLLWSGDITILK